MSNFKHFVAWYTIPNPNDYTVREWLLERLPFEIIFKSGALNMETVENIVNNDWSAFRSRNDDDHYFFKSIDDAIYVKMVYGEKCQ